MNEVYPSSSGGGRPAPPRFDPPDLSEHGARNATSDRRLFMQFLAYGRCGDVNTAVQVIRGCGLDAAVYLDVNDPTGIGIVTMSENPDAFVDILRPALLQLPFNMMELKHHFTMLGRSYALGYETDLDETLIHRPRRHVLEPDWSWVVWYPLRRSGAFEQQSAHRQREILKEHGRIGMAFGQADHAHDVRLAAHGLTRDDNDFVIGLMGRSLHPLSAIVHRMRKTEQTSTYLERLGPFFIGKAIWKSEI